jgi:hypothetical protein
MLYSLSLSLSLLLLPLPRLLCVWLVNLIQHRTPMWCVDSPFDLEDLLDKLLTAYQSMLTFSRTAKRKWTAHGTSVTTTPSNCSVCVPFHLSLCILLLFPVCGLTFFHSRLLTQHSLFFESLSFFFASAASEGGLDHASLASARSTTLDSRRCGSRGIKAPESLYGRATGRVCVILGGRGYSTTEC